jgi:hypothetical protein
MPRNLKLLTAIILSFSITNCSIYKTKYNCALDDGMGCSSIWNIVETVYTDVEQKQLQSEYSNIQPMILYQQYDRYNKLEKQVKSIPVNSIGADDVGDN